MGRTKNQARKKHLKELKRKKIRQNIRLFGKQIPREPLRRPLTFEEFAKIMELNY